jgi:hypothetical protein
MRPTGNHQIGSSGVEAKEEKLKVGRNKTVASIIHHIRLRMKMSPADSLLVYVGESYIPSPHDLVMDLFPIYATDDKLVFSYCQTPAWG